jgi:SAM-dependent MidA family methyltransferase
VVDSLAAGAIFLFDYGLNRRDYYSPERNGGWLRCHFRHHAHDDPLIYPGIQDITAWVDFTAVADAAVDGGARIAGYVNQALFLAAGGLDAELRAFEGEAEVRRMQLSAGIKTLTLPGEMGERFKAMALAKGNIETPAAFGLFDRTHTL